MRAAVAGGIERGDYVHVWSQSQGMWATDGWVSHLTEHAVDVQYMGGSKQKTLPLGSPELRKILDLHFSKPADNPAQSAHGAFSIVLKKDGQKLGLQLVNRQGLAFVKRVVGGAVGQWNAQHTDFEIRPGDQIVEINGRRDSYQEILDLCR